MKVINYISSLFIPTRMGLRKNINIIISFLILLACSYIIAVPYMETFEKMAYEVYCEYESYNFRIFDQEVSKELDFNDDEIEKYGSDYILTSVDDLSKIDFSVKNGYVVMPENISSYDELEYNGKEYILKREVYYYDNDGTKLDDTDIYYIHIVFDIFSNTSDSKYIIKENFDKTFDFSNENHYLMVFYIDGFAYRNEYMIDNNRTSYGFSYNKVDFSFAEIDELDYITKNISEMLIPETKSQYTYNSFIYTVISPLIIALIAYLFIRRKSTLVTYKHYFNIATLCSIPITILFFVLEWNEFMLRLGIMDMYWVILAIYYFIVLSIINRSSVSE